jgi:nucleotide-binding universal stress UspA family protein
MPSGEAPILIAYDGSDNAKHAIAVAGEALAARPALVVTVWESVLGLAYRHPMPGDLGVTQDVVEEMDRGARKAATEAAEEGVELARSAGLDAEPLAYRGDGSTHEAIVELARDREARTVVVGTRGRSTVKAMLLGSVSYGVVHHCRRPVLAVPPADAS